MVICFFSCDSLLLLIALGVAACVCVGLLCCLPLLVFLLAVLVVVLFVMFCIVCGVAALGVAPLLVLLFVVLVLPSVCLESVLLFVLGVRFFNGCGCACVVLLLCFAFWRS